MILKLTYCENPYEVIADYISNHSVVIEDMIAVIEIDGVRRNELLEYDYDNDSFMFLSDWWEGEQEVALIDYFPVSEACNPKTYIPPIERFIELITMIKEQEKRKMKPSEVFKELFGELADKLILIDVDEKTCLVTNEKGESFPFKVKP